MNTQELRIGNFVGANLDVDNENFFTVLETGDMMKCCEGIYSLKLVHSMRIETNFWSSEYFEPIPIREEWLKELGFRKEKNAHKTADLYIHDILSLAKREDEYSCAIHTLLTYPLPVKLKYVHELQNLWFALTKTELVLAVEAGVKK